MEKKKIILILYLIINNFTFSQVSLLPKEIVDKVKSEKFISFLNKFHYVNLPYKFEYKENEMWQLKKNNFFDTMQIKHVVKFLYNDPNEKYNPEKIEYMYGELLPYNSNYIVVVYQRNNWSPPLSETSNELIENILATYDFNGKEISTAIITQKSERHFKKCIIKENFTVECESFFVKNKEKKWPTVLTADHSIETMKIDSSGKINIVSKKEDKNVKVVYDDKTGGYKVAE